VLRAAALVAGSPAGALAERHLAALDALVTGWHGQGPVHLPGGVRAVRRCAILVLGRPTDD
jgi:tRNA(Ile)-lysidine synthase